MAITLAQWKTGWASDAVAVGEPLWETGDYVYLKSESTQASGANQAFKYNPFIVIGILTTTNGAGVIQGLSAAADGTPNTATAGAHYYLRNVSTTETTTAHEFEVDSLANIQALIGTTTTGEVYNWTDPS